VTSLALHKVLSAPKNQLPYRDMRVQLNWLTDVHSMVLRDLGKWDVSVHFLASAARMPEGESLQGYRGPNVSQIINLALTYARMGRVEEAAKLVGKGDINFSEYGYAQILLTRLMIAEQTGDRNESQRALEYLRRRKDDYENTFQIALLEADQLDEAASFLISRLQDTNRRIAALVEVQDYSEYRATFERAPERAKLRLKRWQAVVDRADVQAAIKKVGRIEGFRYRGRI
jgi:hypothetical protein